MIGNKLINLGDASNPTDALNKKYVDSCKQYSRWLWTFSVWYVHEQLKIEKCTHPVNDYVAVDKLVCETRYRKMKNDHQLKISNDGRWDAKDKTDQYQYLGNCPPTPRLTQQQSIDYNFYGNQIDKNIDENRLTI